jgi:hypothetical protein
LCGHDVGSGLGVDADAVGSGDGEAELVGSALGFVVADAVADGVGDGRGERPGRRRVLSTGDAVRNGAGVNADAGGSFESLSGNGTSTRTRPLSRPTIASVVAGMSIPVRMLGTTGASGRTGNVPARPREKPMIAMW